MKSTQSEPFSLEPSRQFDSCAVANAIEAFGVRLRNTGFADASIRCILGEFPPLVGYAATMRVRTSDPPMEGDTYYFRLDWLEHVINIPSPRILVIQDIDRHSGLGSLIGRIHINILYALGCVGVVTNGAVRHVEAARDLGFQLFAGNLSVSHAFAHVSDFAEPVQIGHMSVRPGDLLHGDRHGIQTIPIEIAQEIPNVAKRMLDEEREIVELCRSSSFNLEKLRSAVAALGAKRKKTNA